MSTIFEGFTSSGQNARTACRVAYTINNTQPVICTIIGDQPLFYMDFSAECEEEEMILESSDLRVLQSELEIMKGEIEALDKFSAQRSSSTKEKVLCFLSDGADITSKGPKKMADMDALKAVLSHSRLARAYLDFAAEHHVNLQFSMQTETAFYDREAGLILLNPHINMADLQLLTVQELRRHWQHRQGVLVHPLHFHPDNAVLIHRAQGADLAVSMIRVAWELQLSGEKDAWARIENSPMADLGRAFAREAFLDFRTINNGQACAAVFESWFLSERCKTQDKVLINQMLADYQGYMFDMDMTRHAITPTLISALGAMPYGKNYLAEHAVTIMEDKIFTEVRDRSNANFLWFIKFERSFRETEQKLQMSGDLSAEGTLSSASHPHTQGQTHDHQTHANGQIISLFPAHGQGSDKTGDKSFERSGRLFPNEHCGRNEDQEGHSNVVYLRRWSGE